MQVKHFEDLKLDEIDYKILTRLQKNAQIKKNELAEHVGLSLPSTIDRITKLEEHGYIKSYNAVLDPKKLKLDITCFIFVTSESSKQYKQFVDHCIAAKEVVECHSVTGDGSHILKVRVENTQALEKFLSKIQSWPGVKSTRTSLVLSSHKETTEIELKH
jgi:Lrp/AsnC family leucine-responsive transcriptional regulator